VPTCVDPEARAMAGERLEIHKFGGTSVDGSGCMAAAARRVAEAKGTGTRVVVVASAMAGVTNGLVEAADLAGAGDRDGGVAVVQGLVDRHLEALMLLDPPDRAEVRGELARIGGEIEDLVRGASLLGEMTPRTRDRIVAAGEKLSVRLLAVALRSAGMDAVARDADAFLETDGTFGEASPLAGVADRAVVNALVPLLDRGAVPVVTGFCGRGPDGATTTLGRGGSDLSATLLAAALGADEVTIWTDVDGVFGADPRIVPEARVLPQLNYREAGEMSYYGAKVLHQRTMIPVAGPGIPVRVRNTFRPEAPGTRVDARFTRLSHPVKAITAVRDHCLVSVEGKGMSGVPGVAARAFRALADRGVSATMISQSSSESSICLALPASQAAEAEAGLKREFRQDLSAGDVEDVVVRGGVGLVAAVGLGMAHTPGVAARVFGALARQGVNVLAIAQGSSELNISLAVEATDIDDAVRSIHGEFGLDRADTGVDSPRGLDIVLLGCGKVGRAVVERVLDRSAHVLQRFGLAARIVAVADRTGCLLRPAGIPEDDLRALVQAKAAGGHVADLPGARPGVDAAAAVREALSWRLSRPLLVDVTDAADGGAAWLEAFRGGADVVTANKKPLAGPLDAWRVLSAAAAASRRLVRAEATVGAGLPVVDTMEMLLATGDRVTAAEGSLSGTLGFVTTRLEAGVALSDAVAEAARLGYTEPDPAEDLSGADVARKAVILGRLSGLAAEAPARVEGLVEPLPLGLPRDALMEALRAHDGPVAARVADAKARGQVLRYLARVREGALEVGPVEVPADSPFGRLSGTDNLVLFRSERYDARPLVVSGPGAGVEVTAMAVLTDIFRVAAERRL
jgi:bifunctional aspartokinase / homoserine dehydrogenase 1